ncbi:MAG: peptide-methionine (S)-S-oxide reductase MsrA [Bacteroidales bacterium]|nr:peptide-methionine (S)-S-oxide reductase MsrA [Bacteroidales bacterium]MBQ9194774.1 peptide-methionine (S)-S-oxide reductase MsrA [Bacteroidales bacterium]
MKEIYFAGGCFWGVEHFFKGVDGVSQAMPGYANGNTQNPTYKEVYTDTTGFAETVRVRYNPERVSLRLLTRLFFTVTDPLTLNRQGHDEGTRYRSGVFYTSEEDRPIIEEVFREVSDKLGVPLVTQLQPLKNFYPAEEYHQNYLDKNPEGYCHLSLKTFRYLRLYQDVKLFLGDEPDLIARMANMSALLAERMRFFWTGFYRVAGDQLVLGPFQGPAACQRIGFGKGVCGSAWKERRTLVVPDVEEFPGHIACSSLSKSEIVVPVMGPGGEVVAVLDIDSDEYATFDSVDAAWLELLAEVL